MQSTSALRGRSLSSQQLRNRQTGPAGSRAVQPAWRLSRTLVGCGAAGTTRTVPQRRCRLHDLPRTARKRQHMSRAEGFIDIELSEC